MGLTMVRIFFILTFVITFVAESYAGWQGPAEIMNGIWGSGVGQFGLEQGDSGDDFPEIEAVASDSKIIISDTVNKKQLVFNSDGSFIKEVKWLIKAQSGNKTTYSVPEFSFGTVLGYSSDNNIYTAAGNNFFLKSPTGQLLQTYTEKPLDLGRATEKKLSPGKYKVTVTYPDKVWGIARGIGGETRYIRDLNRNLYGVGNIQIVRYNDCGKEIAKLKMPEVRYQGVEIPPDWPEEAEKPRPITLEEYGSPVLAPNGDVYTWKRTPDKYSIVKWTWQDDPNPPANLPDAPTNLTAKSSANGLILSWTASPQDPGCVTGYEIARSETSGNGYSTIGTVTKGIYKYEDTAAETGKTYYYKIRAMFGTAYSDYSNEASGTR